MILGSPKDKQEGRDRSAQLRERSALQLENGYPGRPGLSPLNQDQSSRFENGKGSELDFL
jgi:hypothetical protein